MSYCNHFRDFLVLSSADLTRLTLVDLDFVPAPGCQQKIRVLLRLRVFKKAPEVFRKRIVLSSSLFGAVSKSKQRHRITHEALLMAANPTKIFSCFLGDSSPLRWGALFAFSSVRHAHTHRRICCCYYSSGRGQKRDVSTSTFSSFLLHTSVVSRLLRPQRNFSLTQFESELSSNTKKENSTSHQANPREATKAKLHQPDCTLSGSFPVGGPFH